MRSVFVLLILLAFHLVNAQVAIVSDDFSDGDFTHNPRWTGDSIHFTVNAAKQLQLDDSAAGSSCLSVAFPVPMLRNQEWRFYIREDFAPSGNNYGRVYLASDRANLKDTVNGYYLQFGEPGSNDAIQLFRQTGTSAVSVCRGHNGEIAAAFAIGVKVTRDSLGTWTIFADVAGGTNYQQEASGTDSAVTSCSYLGVLAVYTVSNATRFYWDDFYAGPFFVNHALPFVTGATVFSSNRLDVLFSGALDTAGASVTSNYRVNQTIGNPIAASLDTTNPSLLHLQFPVAFIPNKLYMLTFRHLKNLAGDTIPPDSVRFWLYLSSAYDVVINEIMAHPSPVVGLPPFEYIELYNRKQMPIALNNWTISEGKYTHVIGAVTIQPDSFVVLCSVTAAAAFPSSLAVYGVTGFGALNNTGAELTLKNDSGRVISCVSYLDTWYGNTVKKNGGWSLEQIDPMNPCGGINNWTASLNPRGGSPGTRNSVYASNPDLVSPQVLRVGVVSPDTICVYFDKPVDSTTVMNPSLYSTTPVLSIQSVHPVGNDYQSVLLCLGSAIQPGMVYSLGVDAGITDCAGNPLIPDHSARFALPVPASPSDLVINELLSDPPEGGVKYVEIYNRSSKILDLQTLNLSSADSVTGIPTDTKTIIGSGYLIFPGDYVLMSTNGSLVKSQYYTSNPKAFVDLPALPKMDIGGGTVLLLSTSGIVIDGVTYSSAWQFPLLNPAKGVSLERIDPDKPSQDAENWHSAAETAGFGTPGYKNSEYMHGQPGSDVTLGNKIFSPDEDGHDDVLLIGYHFETPGFLGNISIYDSRGRLIKSLIKNTLLGAEGSFTWDGIGDDLRKAAVGMYIVCFQVFDLNGNRKEYKRACVLASRL